MASTHSVAFETAGSFRDSGEEDGGLGGSPLDFDSEVISLDEVQGLDVQQQPFLPHIVSFGHQLSKSVDHSRWKVCFLWLSPHA